VTEHERHIAETKRVVRETRRELENVRRNELSLWKHIRSFRRDLERPADPKEVSTIQSDLKK
jgi:hypothetical protein